MNPTIESLVLQHGEQYRRLIEDAVPFLEQFAVKHNLDLDISSQIAELVNDAIIPSHPTPSD